MKQYKIRYQEKGRIKSAIVDEESLKKNSYTIISKQTYKPFVMSSFINRKASFKEVISLFYELDIILQADILFADALEIVSQSQAHPQIKEIIDVMKTTLKNGKMLKEELQNYRAVLGDVVLSFLEIAQHNGNLKSIIHSLVLVLKQIQNSRQKLVNAMMYPMILLCALVFLFLFTFYGLLPQFEMLFAQYQGNLPLVTQSLLNIKGFIHAYGLWSIGCVSILLFCLYAYYQRNETFKYKMSYLLLCKIPFVSRALFHLSFQRLFLLLHMLLKDKYTFQNSFQNAQVVITNYHAQKALNEINQQIQSGKSISYAFKKSCLFDDLTLRLITVGEKSHSLDKTIHEIEKIYHVRLDESIKKLTTYIEPVFFIFIASMVVWIMLAIFMPIWNLGETMGI